MDRNVYSGVLVIGDPHLEGRQPGFRKDDYPEVILKKLEWCLGYARDEKLLPIILGDLFDKPRDNPNWMIGRLLEIFKDEVLGIYGNHDVHYQPELTEHDSLQLLVSAGRLRLVSEQSPWTGLMNGRPVVIGGSSYRQEIPQTFDPLPALQAAAVDDPAITRAAASPLVIWLTHHDILIPGYDEGRLQPYEIDGIELVINGHIHRRLETVCKSSTRWLTPGNISRRSRSDAVREHVPSVLRIDVADSSWTETMIEVPHAPHEVVFHEAILETQEVAGSSAFVAGLAELQARRTQSGEGLKEFLKQNVDQFEPDVAEEIWRLAEEVTREN